MRPIRMSTKEKVVSLQSLCMRSAVKNLVLFSNSSYQFHPKNLPASLRQEILDRLFPSSWEKKGDKVFADTRGHAIIQLLDHEIKKLKFSCLAHNVENEFGDLNLKMMDALIEKATGLQEFDASTTHHDKPPHPFFCKNRLNQLTKLQSLQVLKIEDSVCDDACLDAFSQNLLNLRVLDINLCNVVSSTGIKSLKNLKNLQEFYFRSLKDNCCTYYINSEVQTELMSLCLMHLPQLTVVGYSADTIISPADASHHIVHPDMSHPSKLEYLFVQGQLSPPRAQLLPFVKYLNVKEFICRPVGNYDWLFTFDKLESLSLTKVGCLDLLEILDRVGGNLKNLEVKYVTSGKMDLWRSLEMCPNLEKLFIEGSQFELDFDESVENIQLPSPLNHVIIYSLASMLAYTILPDEFFLRMMSLPLLRKVHFCGVLVKNTEEFCRVTEMVEAGSICQQLEVLSMSLPGFPTEEIDKIMCHELFNKLGAFAPKLRYVDIDADDLSSDEE